MKRIFLLVLILLVPFFAFASGGGESGTKPLILMQNKPEIDEQLKAFAKIFEEKSGIPTVIKTCGGDACAMGTQLRADFNAGEAPDIFTIDGITSYETWKDYLADLSGEAWTSDTDLAFSVGGKAYGFPVSIEGWGMAYNADILAKAGVDPTTLTNYSAYEAAFKKIDAMKSQLGLDSVVSMAASSGMSWVTSHHNFNSYLSNGLARDDLSIVNLGLVDKKLDQQRFKEYADWVKLLFDYADPAILTTGDYDAQVGAFATQKAAFLHQGNWIEPNLANANATFERRFAPHGSMKKDTDGIFVSAPSWYVVNKDGNAEAAKEFLNFLASSPEGHNYMVNEILAIPAFKSVTLKPEAPLSASILEWSSQGKTYAWNQYYFPDAFRGQQLGPIYEQLAKNEITVAEFIDLFGKEFLTLE